MIHAKSESDITSLALSSPSRHPYYVQTPSRDSHDKSSTLHATPVYTSPTDSPSHPSSRFSSADLSKHSSKKPWPPDCKLIIHEEGTYHHLHGKHSNPRRCQAAIAVGAFAVIFTVFCLIILGVSRPYKPKIDVKSLLLENFYWGEGSDHTGVPTKMITVNCSLKVKIYNSASTFGIHVNSGEISLFYSQIAIASGQLQEYYQPRKSRRTIAIVMEGDKIPLYGASAGISLSAAGGAVPMKLDMVIFSRANLVGKLVMVKHRRHISCSFDVDSSKTKPIYFSQDSCTYD